MCIYIYIYLSKYIYIDPYHNILMYCYKIRKNLGNCPSGFILETSSTPTWSQILQRIMFVHPFYDLRFDIQNY